MAPLNDSSDLPQEDMTAGMEAEATQLTSFVKAAKGRS